MWTDPSVVVSVVVAVVAWVGSVGALLWKMGSGTSLVMSSLDNIDICHDGIDKEINIGRESRGVLHKRIDSALAESRQEAKRVELRVVALEVMKNEQNCR